MYCWKFWIRQYNYRQICRTTYLTCSIKITNLYTRENNRYTVIDIRVLYYITYSNFAEFVHHFLETNWVCAIIWLCLRFDQIVVTLAQVSFQFECILDCKCKMFFENNGHLNHINYLKSKGRTLFTVECEKKCARLDINVNLTKWLVETLRV